MKKKAIILLATAVALTSLSAYLQQTFAQSSRVLSDFIATCGTLIQAGFSNNSRGQFDYLIVLIAFIIVLFTLVYSLKYLLLPKEKCDHIKYHILENKTYGKDH